MSKVKNVREIVSMIPDGAVIMVGGFMGVGTPARLVDELVRQNKRNLTIIANDTARPGVGVGKLISANLVRRLVASHIGTNPETQKKMIASEIDVELVPQGSLAERVRSGGTGLGGVLTKTGVGTVVADGRETVTCDGEVYMIEKALKADFALVQAKTADYSGNLTYSLTARNFNPLMAMAAGTTIAEADDIVPVGMVPPDVVITPGVVVDFLVAKEQ